MGTVFFEAPLLTSIDVHDKPGIAFQKNKVKITAIIEMDRFISVLLIKALLNWLILKNNQETIKKILFIF
jgi:hypothetical protein